MTANRVMFLVGFAVAATSGGSALGQAAPGCRARTTDVSAGWPARGIPPSEHLKVIERLYRWT